MYNEKIFSQNEAFINFTLPYLSYKVDDNHHTADYSCLEGKNNTLTYVFQLKKIDEYLRQTLPLEQKYSVFKGKLDKGKTYSKDGYHLFYIMTEDEQNTWKKGQPQRDYLKSIKDTIDCLLKAELLKQKINLDGINCYENYTLRFGKNGHLKEVNIADYDKSKLEDGLRYYLKEKREIRKCKRKVKSIFKPIDLSFLHLEYEFYRTISFLFDKKGRLMDNTDY